MGWGANSLQQLGRSCQAGKVSGLTGTFFASLLAISALVQPAMASSDAGLLYDGHGDVAGFKLNSSLTFEKNSSQLSHEGKEAILALYKRIAADVAMKVSIVGYSDSSGSDQTNQVLSTTRAQQVRDYLLVLGLPPSHIVEVKGLGASDPVADNGTESGRLANRRVELHIAGKNLKRAPVVQTARQGKHARTRPEAASEGNLSAFAFGVGYPDVRLRLGIGDGWNVEAKAAFAQNLQIYSGRIFWDFASLGPFQAVAGGEGGWAKFDGVDGISGNGSFFEGFLGAEYPFARQLRVSVDVGPAWIQASAQNVDYRTQVLVYNTALYYFFF